MRGTIESESFVLKVLDDAKNLGKEKQEQIARLIAIVGTPFIPYLLERMANENERVLRSFYLVCLKKLGPSVIEAAGKWLNDERWYVLRNILELLLESDGRTLISKIRPLVKHQHPKVKFEAIKACLAFRDTSVLGILLKDIDSPDEEISLPAIQLASHANDKRINTKLLDILGKHAIIGNYHLKIKRAVVRTLAEKKHPSVLPLFEDILSSRDLFHGHDHAELKLEVIKSLAKYPPGEVLEILREHEKSGSGDSAGEAAALLQRIERGKS
jgi:HEAT repeat protein